MKNIFIVILFIFSVNISACDFSNVLIEKTTLCSNSKNKILPIGDSITAIETNSWRYKLQTLLGVGAYNFVGSYNIFGETSFDEDHSSVGGDTTATALVRLNAKELPYNFLDSTNGSIVLIYIGVNDLRSSTDPDVSVGNIKTMLENIHAENGNIGIYVSLIYPWVDDTNYTKTISFNSKLDTMLDSYKLNENNNVFIVDVYSQFISNANWVAEYTTDGIHPNDTGNIIIANLLYNSIVANEGA